LLDCGNDLSFWRQRRRDLSSSFTDMDGIASLCDIGASLSEPSMKTSYYSACWINLAAYDTIF